MMRPERGQPLADSKIDLRVALLTPLLQFLPWLASVAVVTLAGYPGVVCVTPMAWLIALRVGLVCVRTSASPTVSQRLKECAIAGGVLGLLQGLLFVIVTLGFFSLQPDEVGRALLLAGIVIVLGAGVSAGLTQVTARLEMGRINQG
jgi:hypothetical protein